jgi:hypothetical protein
MSGTVLIKIIKIRNGIGKTPAGSDIEKGNGKRSS